MSFPLLFTENETNHVRLFGGTNATPFVKDGINDYLVQGRADAVVAQVFVELGEPRDEGKLELVNIELFVVEEGCWHEEGWERWRSAALCFGTKRGDLIEDEFE